MNGRIETTAIGADLCTRGSATQPSLAPEIGDELPIGLAASYATLASAHARHGLRPDPGNYAALRVFRWLSMWIPPYLRATFLSERRWWPRSEWREVEEDAVQHGLLAVLIRGTERWSGTSDDHALRWTKAVVRNFVITQCVRLRTKRALMETSALPTADIENTLQVRESLAKLISLVRNQLSSVARPRDLASVLEAYDELVAFSFRSMRQHEDAAGAGSDRARHRRLRTRRLVRRAIERLLADNQRRDMRSELLRFARLTGVDAV